MLERVHRQLGTRMKSLFVTLLLSVSPLQAGWFSKATPTPSVPAVAPTAVPTPVKALRHCLVRMNKDKQLAAYAVVDAFTQTQGGHLQAWQMQVTYYLPAKKKGQPMASFSRNYGPSVATKAGDTPISLDLAGPHIRLSLPTLDGQHVIPLEGDYVFNSRFHLSGTAKLSLGTKRKPVTERWEAHSVASFKNMGMTIRGD